ncbi:aldehyde dehydrogenase family protein [Nocardioides sp. B-3]|uniref:aldehyde dehydrogenase family protein n=1 Tax=Nocardioides sp. B-3 TaxID=2895565 RepID=UPI002153880A|nr:aldehyde dehydrogenase family protein [Nocardioides sp. B-3]
MARIDVKKTYKLYIGGQFPRSESGRSYVVNDAKGNLMANAAQASRKDARDAVIAARQAFGGWSSKTAYNRSQVIYRIAEVLEGRRDQFVAELRASEGVTAAKANTFVDAAIDRLVWYAGWADKITRWSAPPTRSRGPTSTSPRPSRPASSQSSPRAVRSRARSVSSRRSSSPATPAS